MFSSLSCTHGRMCVYGPQTLPCKSLMHYTWSRKSYGLYPFHGALQVSTLFGVVASVCTPRPTRTQPLPTLLGQQCWELLHPFEHHCKHLRNNSQRCRSNNVGSSSSVCTRAYRLTSRPTSPRPTGNA